MANGNVQSTGQTHGAQARLSQGLIDDFLNVAAQIVTLQGRTAVTRRVVRFECGTQQRNERRLQGLAFANGVLAIQALPAQLVHQHMEHSAAGLAGRNLAKGFRPASQLLAHLIA
ncbi:hypothetical protein D3C86_1229980 [compost metagenome]